MKPAKTERIAGYSMYVFTNIHIGREPTRVDSTNSTLDENQYNNENSLARHLLAEENMARSQINLLTSAIRHFQNGGL